MKRAIALLPLVALIAFVPAGLAAGWTARMTVPTHTPKAGKRWPVKIVVKTASGRPLNGTVQYHFLLGNQVVATRDCHTGNFTRPCPFRGGIYRDVIHWPAEAAGHRLTFQATVRTRLGKKNLDYWVKVRR